MALNYITPGERGRGKEIQLRPLRPNAGLEALYRKKIIRLVDEMNRSVSYWIEGAYKRNEPLMAMDASPNARAAIELFDNPSLRPPPGHQLFVSSTGELVTWDETVARMAMDDAIPANALAEALKAMSKRWLKQFDDAAPELAKYFSKAVWLRTDKQLQSILRKGGFSVRFKMTKVMKDVVNATTQQNIALIKSIPEQYLKNVEGAVMRSIQTGRDLGPLAKELEKNFGVTKRRAAFIARDQNNKATSAMNRVRQTELGITQAKWKHSHGGKHPRPTHLANDGNLYDVAKGWYDPHVKKYIFPGELPNCRCVSISVIPGFS